MVSACHSNLLNMCVKMAGKRPLISPRLVGVSSRSCQNEFVIFSGKTRPTKLGCYPRKRALEQLLFSLVTQCLNTKRNSNVYKSEIKVTTVNLL